MQDRGAQAPWPKLFPLHPSYLSPPITSTLHIPSQSSSSSTRRSGTAPTSGHPSDLSGCFPTCRGLPAPCTCIAECGEIHSHGATSRGSCWWWDALPSHPPGGQMWSCISEDGPTGRLRLKRTGSFLPCSLTSNTWDHSCKQTNFLQV